MKKLIYSILSISLLLFLFSACDEEVEIWESSTDKLDGNWYVSYDHSQYGEDPFGVGLTLVHTYNTAADNGQEIWLTDEGHFWDYKVKLPANPGDLTFGSEQEINNIATPIAIDTIPVESGEPEYLITPDTIRTADGDADSLIVLYRYHQTRVQNGKIFLDAVQMPSGVTSDSIYFEIWFEDLEGSTGIPNDTLYVSGFRQTGFQEDEP